MNSQIKIGHIMSTHGLKGEVKIFLLTDLPDDYYSGGNKVTLRSRDGTSIEKVIRAYRPTPKNTCLVFFEDILTIEQAEPIIKMDVFAQKKQIKGKIYLADLIGYKVTDEKDEELGTVESVQNIGGKAYLYVGSSLLPYIPDIFIKSLDDKTEKLVVTEQGEDIIKNA